MKTLANVIGLGRGELGLESESVILCPLHSSAWHCLRKVEKPPRGAYMVGKCCLLGGPQLKGVHPIAGMAHLPFSSGDVI